MAANRRKFLKLTAAGVAGAAALAACSAPATPTAVPAPKATEAPKPTEAPKAAEAPKPTEAPKAAPTADAKAPAAKGPKIVIATRSGGDAEQMTKNAPLFTAETGVQAEAVAYGPQVEYFTKVQALHASKTPPDVIWASLAAHHEFANRGIINELDSLAKAANYDLGDYVPNALKTLSLKGKLYGLPWGGHPGDGGLLYNIDLLAKAGITATEDPESILEWTYDKLTEYAQKTTLQTGGRTTQFGYFPNVTILGLINVVGAFGGRFLNADGTKADFESEGVLKGLQWQADMFAKHKVSPTPDPSQNASEWFATGKVATLGTGYWGQFDPGDKAIAGKFKWNVSLQPKGPTGKRGTSLMINGQCVSSLSQNKEGAFKFVTWLMDPKVNVATVLSGGSRPCLRNAVLDHPDLMTKMKAHKVFAKAIKEAEAHMEPANYRWQEWADTLAATLQGVWAGTQTLEQALPEAKKKVQAVLDKAPA